MRITNRLMLAVGNGYYKTTRWCGEPKSNWKRAAKKVEKKKLREFFRRCERREEIDSQKFAMGLEYEIEFRKLDILRQKSEFKRNIAEYEEEFRWRNGYWGDFDIGWCEVQKKVMEYATSLINDIANDEKELNELIEFHSMWED